MAREIMYTEKVAIVNHVRVTQDNRETEQILALDRDALSWFDLRRGDIVTFETVDVVKTTKMVKCYRHGFTGQEREEVVSTETDIVNVETKKLWHTAKSGWYWIAQCQRASAASTRAAAELV